MHSSHTQAGELASLAAASLRLPQEEAKIADLFPGAPFQLDVEPPPMIEILPEEEKVRKDRHGNKI